MTIRCPLCGFLLRSEKISSLHLVTEDKEVTRNQLKVMMMAMMMVTVMAMMTNMMVMVMVKLMVMMMVMLEAVFFVRQSGSGTSGNFVHPGSLQRRG